MFRCWARSFEMLQLHYYLLECLTECLALFLERALVVGSACMGHFLILTSCLGGPAPSLSLSCCRSGGDDLVVCFADISFCNPPDRAGVGVVRRRFLGPRRVRTGVPHPTRVVTKGAWISRSRRLLPLSPVIAFAAVSDAGFLVLIVCLNIGLSLEISLGPCCP